MAKPFQPGGAEAISEAYQDVRRDDTETNWALFGYDGKFIVHVKSGVDYQELLGLLDDDGRNYIFVRFETGDEMSRRKKFALITWIGNAVSPLKKAKVSTDKAFVKEIITSFGKEFLVEGDKNELKEEKVLKELERASGAAYGTGGH
eukprot:Em0018g334a